MNKNHTDIQEIISRMTLEQKARMCSGKDFWHLEGL
jgi:beta-glucosidase